MAMYPLARCDAGPGARVAPFRPGLGSSESLVASLVRGAGQVTRGSIRRVTLRSNLSPDVDLTAAQAAGQPRGFAVNEAVLRMLQPEIEVETELGSMVVAPYGSPTTNLFWPVVIVGAATALAVGILAYRGATC